MAFSSGEVLTAANLNALEINSLAIGETSPTWTVEFATDDDVTDFSSTTKGGVCISNSHYDANDFTCLDFGYTGNDNPLGRIGLKISGSGSEMWFGTSATFGSGITNEAIKINNAGAVTIAGALSKGSGTFDIAHPTKGGQWRLRHSFIEGPKADLLYRGTATIAGSGNITVDLDAAAGLTAGTWEALNQDPWTMVTSSGNAVTWSFSGKTLTINGPANSVCQWLVIGERKDQTVIDWAATDSDGHLIPEYDASIADTNDATK